MDPCADRRTRCGTRAMARVSIALAGLLATAVESDPALRDIPIQGVGLQYLDSVEGTHWSITVSGGRVAWVESVND